MRSVLKGNSRTNEQFRPVFGDIANKTSLLAGRASTFAIAAAIFIAERAGRVAIAATRGVLRVTPRKKEFAPVEAWSQHRSATTSDGYRDATCGE